MTITSYLLVLSLLWLLALFFIFEIWSFAYSLDDDAMMWFMTWASLISFIVVVFCLLPGIWLYRRRNGLRIWLEIIANPPISQLLSLEDKERYLLYFDWEEGKTLCRSQLNPTTKFFEEDFPKGEQTWNPQLSGLERNGAYTPTYEGHADYCFEGTDTDTISPRGFPVGSEDNLSFYTSVHRRPELYQGLSYKCIDTWFVEHTTCPCCQRVVGDDSALLARGQLDHRPTVNEQNRPRTSWCRLFCIALGTDMSHRDDIPTLRSVLRRIGEAEDSNTVTQATPTRLEV